MVASPISQRLGVTEKVDRNVNKNVPNQAFKVSIKGHNEYYVSKKIIWWLMAKCNKRCN